MKLLEREEPLGPREQAELDAVDRALSGRDVDPALAEWAELTQLLTAERPEPGDDWATELDERAAAGFPRRGGGAWLRGLLPEGKGVRPLRLAGPAGALATCAVVAVVAVSTLGDDGGDASSGGVLQPIPGMSEKLSGESQSSTGAAAQATEQVPAAGATALEEALPPDTSLDAGLAAGDGYRSTVAPKDAKIAPGTAKRRVDRNVQLTLSTRPDEVRDLSDEVIAITRSLGGIVASSQVSVVDGDRGRSQATLQLTLPTKNLDAAIDRLTGLANVDSLNEATEDITRPFVSAQDEVDDLEALRARLLEALGNASTDAEAEALRLQIEDARDDLSRAEAALENIARQAQLSDLSVTIVGDPNAKEDRDLGAWFDDAVDVLRDIAGILLISAAILVPLGILVALGWLAGSRSRRRRRERALD